MFKKILLSFIFVCTTSAQAYSQTPPRNIDWCYSQIPYGQPVSQKKSLELICRQAYLVAHDNNAKIPLWVSYTLTPPHATGCEKRVNAFKSDRSLPADKRAELKDYAKSKYDTGHMANSADMSWDVEVARESFILSNMTPQLPEFNRGIWKKLEDQVRAWAVDRNHTMLIYVSSVYNKDQSATIGTNMVTVPNAFYKIIIDTETKEVLVFRFDNAKGTGSLTKFITSLAQAQNETGIVFPMPKQPMFSTEAWSSVSKNVSKLKSTVCSIG